MKKQQVTNILIISCAALAIITITTGFAYARQNKNLSDQIALTTELQGELNKDFPNLSVSSSPVDTRSDNLTQPTPNTKVVTNTPVPTICPIVYSTPLVIDSPDTKDADAAIAGWKANQKEIYNVATKIDTYLSNIEFNNGSLLSFATPQIGEPIRRVDAYPYISAIGTNLTNAQRSLANLEDLVQ